MLSAADLAARERWLSVATTGNVFKGRTPSGAIRYRVELGRDSRGRRMRLSSWHGLRFTDEAHAQQALEQFRATLAARGIDAETLYAEVTGRGGEEALVGYWIERYLAQFRRLVDAEQRSPGTLREMERYAQPGGHWSWWQGTAIKGLTYGQVEDWHAWLAERGIKAKTQKNVSDTFRTFLRWAHKRDETIKVPPWPTISVPRYVPTIIGVETQLEILDAIPWEQRGAFLAAATEALRAGEVAACTLTDYRDGKLRVARAVQGHGAETRVAERTKNDAGEWRELWNTDLSRWCAERVAAASPEAALRGEALFWNPRARNALKRPTHDWLERVWRKACSDAQVEPAPSFQEGTRHAILTALGQVLPERALRAFSRHADARSLDHYAKPKPSSGAIVRALKRNED